MISIVITSTIITSIITAVSIIIIIIIVTSIIIIIIIISIITDMTITITIIISSSIMGTLVCQQEHPPRYSWSKFGRKFRDLASVLAREPLIKPSNFDT